MKIQSVEISFPVPVELPKGWDQRLDAMVGEVCAAYVAAHPDRVMWPFGCGSKPRLSRADLAFLDKPDDPAAPAFGEPTFDDSVFQIEVAEREAYPEDIARRTREQAPASPSAVGEGQAPTEQQLWDLLRGTCYLDPPDGGDVPLLEQLSRMSADAAKYRALSSQAPASAVGEGQPIETQQIMIRDPCDPVVLHVYKRHGSFHPVIEEYRCSSPENARDLLNVIALSSQASKPASAGGETDWRHIANEYADAAANGIQWIRNIENGCSTSETAIAEMQANMKRIRAIAAEADTAKDETCPNCVSPYKCNGPHISEHPPHGYEAPDRLAPIEARGADIVSIARNEYERLRAIQNAMRFSKEERWYWTGDETDDPQSLTCPVVMSADTLRKILRARESAPAVEPTSDK